MFTVHDPEKPVFGKVVVTTLKSALMTKNNWQNNLQDCHAIITDADGYVVSTKEQEEYLQSLS